jgi:4,5-dihydroxyphthalate decarboxylase
MTTESIEVPIGRMRYDYMAPLYDGRVEIPGVTLKPGRGVGGMVTSDNPDLREGNFGVTDLNLGFLPQMIEAEWEVKALPVLSKRKPVLQFIWARTDRGINAPKDLEGKTVATAYYTTAITVFARGFLEHRYGVDLGKLRWKVGTKDYFPLHDESLQIEVYEDRKTPVDRLLAGEVDAILTDVSDRKAWETLATSSEIKLLFPNYMDEDFKIYQETGIYTPVHLVVMSKKLDAEHPELARKLFDAFEQAKQLAYDDALNDRAGFSVLYQREITFEQLAKWGDAFKYGMEANRSTFDTYFQYNLEQGIVKHPVSYEAAFAGSTLDT